MSAPETLRLLIVDDEALARARLRRLVEELAEPAAVVVAEADSAALALVLDWLRVSRESGHRLELLAMPKGLATLAALYGIDTLIPLHEVCPQ